MPITELLTRNATYFKDDIALVEINPEVKSIPHITWREYSLIESKRGGAFRKQLTWGEFEVKANRFANLLLTRGIKKGDKVFRSISDTPQRKSPTVLTSRTRTYLYSVPSSPAELRTSWAVFPKSRTSSMWATTARALPTAMRS